MTAVSVPVANLTRGLSRLLGRSVIDKTDLTGNFRHPRPAPANAAGPSIFTALQEQLGLKLESQKAPVEVLIAERVEKPSEN